MTHENALDSWFGRVFGRKTGSTFPENALEATQEKGVEMAARLIYWGLAALALLTLSLTAPDALARTNYIGEIAGVEAVDDGTFDEFHVRSDVNFSQYAKVYIAPVGIVHGRDKELKKFSDRDLQGRQDRLHELLVASFSGRFQIADAPGPDVLVVETAITSLMTNKATHDQETSQHVVGYSRFHSFYRGRAAFQATIKDGASDDILAIVVDRRLGHDINHNFKNRWRTWGDVEDFMTIWARELSKRLYSEAAPAPCVLALALTKPQDLVGL